MVINMKKTAVSIQFDEEKLSAVKLYMSKKGSELDAELATQLEKLYEKHVPSSVRDFISERYSDGETGRKKPDGSIQ